jgi:hypothetical protein
VKAQISRVQHRPGRFAGVHLQQGRMITDADWNESVEVAKERLRALAGDVVGSGVPAAGGLLTDIDELVGALRWGVAYADGVRGVVAPADGDLDAGFDLGAQADLLAAAGTELQDDRGVYLDVWERTVVAAEDDELTDPAFDGADTGFRTRVMAQLKQCDVVGGVPECLDADRNPPRGDARLEARLRGADEDPDPCDPCADELAVEQPIGNHLFRLEVHDVEGPATDPDRIVLKWSAENGAEQHRLEEPRPARFDVGGHHAEYVTTRTEQNLGVFLDPADGWEIGPGVLRPVGDPVPDPAVAGDEWTVVRRWDGWCALERRPGGWVAVEGRERDSDLVGGAGDRIEVSGATVTLPLGTLELRLALPAGVRVVRGDHWLVEVREGRDTVGEAVRLRSPTGEPDGVEHRTLYLGVWREERLHLDDDAHRRRVSFPALTDLPATAVAYEPDCDTGLYPPDVATVADALDAVCDLDAAHVGHQSDCGALAGTDNVGEALEALCAELEATVRERWPRRVLFGRGVVCGVLPESSVRRNRDDALVEALHDGLVAERRSLTLDPVDSRRLALAGTVAGGRTRGEPGPVEAMEARLREEGADDAVERARETVAELAAPEAADRLERIVDLIDDARRRPGAVRDTEVVRFRTSAGVLIDGTGGIHRIDTLTHSEPIEMFRVVLRLSHHAVRDLQRRLLELARQRPGLGGGQPLVADTWRRDLEERVEEIVSLVVGGQFRSVAEVSKALAQLGWRSTRLRDAVAEVVVAGMEQDRVPVETVGWLYVVFGEDDLPALDFRTTPPAAWLTAPSVFTGGTRVKASPSVVEHRVGALLADELEAVDLAALVERIEDRRGDDGGLSIDEVATLIGEARGGPVTASRRADLIEEVAIAFGGASGGPVLRGDVAGAGFGGVRGGPGGLGGVAGVAAGVEAVEGLGGAGISGAVAEALAAAEAAGGHVIATAGNEVVVDDRGPSLGEIHEAIWRPYGEPRCLEENDGSVCVAKVGCWGSTVVIAPDDREQLFATPANLSAMMAERMPEVFDQLLARAKGDG